MEPVTIGSRRGFVGGRGSFGFDLVTVSTVGDFLSSLLCGPLRLIGLCLVHRRSIGCRTSRWIYLRVEFSSSINCNRSIRISKRICVPLPINCSQAALVHSKLFLCCFPLSLSRLSRCRGRLLTKPIRYNRLGPVDLGRCCCDADSLV